MTVSSDRNSVDRGYRSTDTNLPTITIQNIG